MAEEQSALLNGAQLKELQTARADGRSAIRVVVQLSIFVGALLGLLLLDGPMRGGPAASPLLHGALLGCFSFMLFALYAPFHECTHQTAFSSKRANEVVAWITGLLYGYSPGLHRAFHFEHHRHTNELTDPEAGFGLPAMPLRLLWQALLAGLLGSFVPLHSLVLALTPTRHWDQAMAPWAPVARRRALAWECRIVALSWIGGIAMVVLYSSLGLELLIALLVARSIHGLVTVSEHEELPGVGRQIDRTRTVTAGAVFNWFWWNMSYHAEHHAWASIPWHQLPAVHALVRDRLPHIERGYGSFLVGRLLHRAP